MTDWAAPDKRAELARGLQGLADRPEAAEAMAGVRLERFDPLDTAALERAAAAFDAAAE